MTGPVLDVEKLSVHFPVRGDGLFSRRLMLRAVDEVSLSVDAGETLGIVGESGCGKSTLARAIVGLVPVTGGTVKLLGETLDPENRPRMRDRRRLMQIVFQDPLAALNPRMTVGEIIAEPLRVFEPGINRQTRIARVSAEMDRVGLLSGQINRYPHEFSGGQCQRIGIARALILGPRLLICDEPVSALDVSIRAQIVNLLMDIQAERRIALVFIAHDLAVVRHLSHRILVMYLGRIVEIAPAETICRAPGHPYTRALIDAIPLPDPRLERQRQCKPLHGELPSPTDPPSGCVFRTRCPIATGRCAEEVPVLRQGGQSRVACHHPDRA